MLTVARLSQGKQFRLARVAAGLTREAVGAETGGRLSAHEFATPPRTAGPPLHLHRGWDEAFYVLEGEMTFLVDGRTFAAPAGSFVFVPRGVLHTFWNESAAPARPLTVFTPAGIEDSFEEATRVPGGSGGRGPGGGDGPDDPIGEGMEHHRDVETRFGTAIPGETPAERDPSGRVANRSATGQFAAAAYTAGSAAAPMTPSATVGSPAKKV